MRDSTVILLANDIQFPVGILTTHMGLGLEQNDEPLNFVINPIVLTDEFDEDEDDDLEEIRIYRDDVDTNI
jgi:hypothetical protein